MLPSVNFNNKYALPNKFFEFIQARLALAIGPSLEMKRIVEQTGCGFFSSNFSAQCMADCLNRLSVHQIEEYKQKAHEAARSFSLEQSQKQILSIVNELL